ncbi:MAG TPA: hypothetical protein VMU90_04315 [Solirubrobacteraceae bacterium]|nr:hypothetical protein [Solirubrobacteraceae bacterium]
MVEFEFSGVVYPLSDDQATLLAHKLRSCAKGKLPDEVTLIGKQSGNPHWADGALAVADFAEEILVGNWPGPLPLEGKAAEATFWTLRLIEESATNRDSDAAALRGALAERFAAVSS